MVFFVFNIYLFTMILFNRINIYHTLVYSLIVFSAFYSVSLINISSITYDFKIPEYLSILLILNYIFTNKRIDRKALLFLLTIILVMFLSYFVRTIHFIPIEVWELEISNRVNIFDKFITKNSLSLTNITQMLYVVLGASIFVIYGSIKLPKKKLLNKIYSSLFLILAIALLQLLFYYTNNYDIYLNVFYSIDPTGTNSVLAFQEFYGIKRINSVLVEPSIFGYYVTLTLIFLLLFDKEEFKKRKKLVVVSILLVFLSTSMTGYLGLILVFICYNIYEKNYKKLVIIAMIIGVIISVVIVYYHNELLFLINLKSSSIAERFLFGFTLPIESFIKMPFFGIALGTDRPTVMLINLILAIGMIGTTLLFLIGKVIFKNNKKIKFYLIFLFIIGISVPDFRYLFFWIYLGLLYNPLYKRN